MKLEIYIYRSFSMISHTVEFFWMKNTIFSDCKVLAFLILSFRIFILFFCWIRVAISSSLIWLTKTLCCCCGNVLIRPSAIIFFVAVHWNRTHHSECSCLSQWLWISTWCSFVDSFIDFSVICCNVCLLLHSMISSSFRFSIRLFNSWLTKIASFVICNRASSSASVLDIVTVFCLLAFHAIDSSNSSMI